MGGRFLCVGTHHKTGTVWLRRVLHSIKREQDIPLMQCHKAGKLAKAAPRGPQIIVNWESSFPDEIFALPHARFIHMIRDPRDVLLSGMRYHRIAPLAREKFLAKTAPGTGALNYQDHLNALPDDHARLMFEMENKHHQTVEEMKRWTYGRAGVAELRYEDLIEDHDCAIFRSVLVQMNIEGLDVDRAVKSYWEYSLFGGMKSGENKVGSQHAKHLASGKKRQWESQMPRSIAEIYAARYGDVLRQLGYEENSDWVDKCAAETQIETVNLSS